MPTLFLLIITSVEKSQVQWRREEALARVAAAEMLDLPLTESQANIEIEFSEDDDVTLFGIKKIKFIYFYSLF